MRTKRSIVPALLHALGVLALTASTTVSAGALITYGKTTLGVNDQGHLNFFSDTGPDSSQFGFTYGVYRAGLGDAISPACLCEGWGVSALVGSESFASWASVDTGGVSGLGSGTFGATVNTATSVVDSSVMPMTIRHAFGPSLATDLFQVQVTLTNTSTTETLSDLTYRRAMDWDVPPTEFREFVTHSGVTANLTSNGGNLKYASDDGFAIVEPAGSRQTHRYRDGEHRLLPQRPGRSWFGVRFQFRRTGTRRVAHLQHLLRLRSERNRSDRQGEQGRRLALLVRQFGARPRRRRRRGR
jgi:hypothetical protein